MKYRIEILRYCNLVEEHRSDNIEDILEWYKTYWQSCYDWGGCAFNVYRDDKELDFDEEYELGFYR